MQTHIQEIQLNVCNNMKKKITNTVLARNTVDNLRVLMLRLHLFWMSMIFVLHK
jgi:hypothetical protein